MLRDQPCKEVKYLYKPSLIWNKGPNMMCACVCVCVCVCVFVCDSISITHGLSGKTLEGEGSGIPGQQVAKRSFAAQYVCQFNKPTR